MKRNTKLRLNIPPARRRPAPSTPARSNGNGVPHSLSHRRWSLPAPHGFLPRQGFAPVRRPRNRPHPPCVEASIRHPKPLRLRMSRLGVNQSAFRNWDFPSQFAGGFNPLLCNLFHVRKRFAIGCAICDTTRQFWDLCDECVIFCAPIENYFIFNHFHLPVYISKSNSELVLPDKVWLSSLSFAS